MKTVLVVFTQDKVSDAEIRRMKRYSFNTKSDLKVGEMIVSDRYSTPMQVVRVLDKTYKYYNGVTGKLSNLFTSSQQWEITELVVREKSDADVVYAARV